MGMFLNATNQKDAMKEGLKQAAYLSNLTLNPKAMPKFPTYHYPFDYYDVIFKNTDDADKFFENLGNHKGGVCRVKAADDDVYDAYHKKIMGVREEKQFFLNGIKDLFLNESGNQYITCNCCQSKFLKPTIAERNLICPICGNLVISKEDKLYCDDLDKKVFLLEKELGNYIENFGHLRYYMYFYRGPSLP